MNPIDDNSYRTGHTLMELVVAMVASTMLLAGLGSVMLIARQVAYTPSGATRRTDAANNISQLTDELQYATFLVGYSDKVLEFVVSDRTANGAAERIRYEWSGTSGDKKLRKTINGSTPSVIAEDVYDCHFDVQPSVVAGPLAAQTLFTQVLVRLQIGAASHSRVNAAIPLISRPQLLSAYWRADFDPAPALSPSAIDVDASGSVDWVASNGASFSGATLQNGAWLANGDLATNPANDFVKTTAIQARCKNMAPSGAVDVLSINADRQGTTSYAPLIVRMERQLDGSQSLTLLGKPTSGSEQLLRVVNNLTDDYVRFRLIILPDTDSVSLEINDIGVDVLGGPYPYPTHAPISTDRCVKIGGGAKFDYVEVRIANN